MLKLLRILSMVTVVLAGLGLQSCKEDIDFSGEKTNTALVFGLLNQADSIHYIKITRAFGGDNNGIIVAQIPDSSYFPVMTAKIIEAGGANRTWILRDTMLDGKTPGAFYGPIQKVYYFKAALNESATYKLDINVNNDEFHVTGETKLVTGVTISAPTGNTPFNFSSSNAADEGYKSTSIVCTKGNSAVINCQLETFIKEFINGVPVEKSFRTTLGELSGSQLPGNPSFIADGKSFYTNIAANCTNDPLIPRRQFSRIRIHITAGSEDLAKYILINKPSTSLAQNKSTFTNLEATNDARVIGLFSARVSIMNEKLKYQPSNPLVRGITPFSMKELCTGQITGSFNFCSDNPNDQLLSYYCD